LNAVSACLLSNKESLVDFIVISRDKGKI